MTVTLRNRKKGTKTSLYLDIYNKGRRYYEYLELYLIPEPTKGKLTKEQKETNKETLALAESIRAKKQVEIQNGIYGFLNKAKTKGSFLKYFEMLTEKRNDNDGNYGNWGSTLLHLKGYAPADISFGEIDKKWVAGFRDYLKTTAKKSNKQPLGANSQCSYFSKVKAALKEAVKDGIINQDPSIHVESPKATEGERQYLTLDELKKLFTTDCSLPLLKNAFLFASLTGLRWSDVEKLTWREVQHSKEQGHYIRFTQKKTKGAETQPISEQAYNLLGKRAGEDDKVFDGLQYNAWNNLKLQQWVMDAGISKKITFHCSRHTYATLQLTLGTDIYTVSKLLGHKELKTTQIYGKIIDERKREAADKIIL